jgi:D-lactate dehydrogenase (cytochrome)
MTSWTLRSREPEIDNGSSGAGRSIEVLHDPDLLAGFVEDAAHFPGGHAAGVAIPDTEAGVSQVLKGSSASVLAVGAQSSLTGGATPRGDVVLSTRKLTRIDLLSSDRVRV